MQLAARTVFSPAHPPPAILSAAFIVLVAVLVLVVLWWVNGPANFRGRTWLVAIPLLVWLALSAVAAATGALANFDAIPPHVVYVVFPAVITILVIAFRPGTAPVLDRVPGDVLISFQVFRIAMEIVLWRLARAGVIPASMTFEGRNYDIIVGLTAPFIAWLYARRMVSPGPVIFWNVFGIVVLANVVLIGFLSAPTPFRQYFEGPPNEMIAHFPFVWLVSFVVPLAFLGHLLSIRQLLRTLKHERAPRPVLGRNRN
jgi:hypothetical protein